LFHFHRSDFAELTVYALHSGLLIGFLMDLSEPEGRGYKRLRVLMIEDSLDDAELLERQLKACNVPLNIHRVVTPGDMRDALAHNDYELIIADYSVPGFGAIPALKLLKQSGLDIPFIIVSGTISDETAIEAMRAGAHDYIVKGNLARLVPAIEREIQEAAIRRQQRETAAALRQADESLQLREARLQGIIGSAMDAIISLDEQQNIIVFNHAAAEMFGCTLEDAIGTSLDRFIPPRYRRVHREHVRLFGRENSTTRSMHSLGTLFGLRSNGEEFPIEATISQVQAGGEKLYTVILRDVTERRRTEEALRHSEERLRAVYNHAAVGIEQTLADGSLLMVNPAFCSMLGYSKEELRGMTSEQITSPEDRDHEAELFQSMLREGRECYAMEKRYLRKDGSSVWTSITGSVVKDLLGKPLYRVTIVQDITERKRAELLEEQLQQVQKLESLGQLAGAVAHDFNTLLNVILGYAELLKDELNDHDARRARVERIEASAQSGSQLTKQLLAFSRKQSFVPHVIELQKSMKDMQPMLRRLLPEDIEIRFCSPETLCPVKVDPGRLQQVVLNLATNARDAMPRGGCLTIEVRTIEIDEKYLQKHASIVRGRYVMLAVSDTGVGMSAETAERMFEPFYTTKPEGKGTGLGLSTVYGIVKQCGGDIWVYSEQGVGSIFKVYLPLSTEAVESSEDVALVPENLSGSETILLVEDSKALRELTRELLTRVGYAVLEAADGQEAVELSQTYDGNIDLLLTDVVLPRMRGPEVAEIIAKQRPYTAIVFLSGYTEEALSQMDSTRRITLVEKPYAADTLLRTVRQILDELQKTAQVK
jgi:PAS domain S-box-containing protein